MAKIPSFLRKKKNSTKKIFVGRQKQLDLFQDNINKGPNDEDFHNIFNIYGQGGVGKSTLISKYIDIANQKDYVFALIDTEDKRTYDILATMKLIAADFEKQGFPFKKFDENYTKYLQETKKLEAEPDKPDGLLGALVSSTIKGGAELTADLVPGGNTINKLLPTNAIADNLGKWADFAWKKLKNKDEVELVLEPLKVLTPLWLQGLGACMSKKNIALFFDTYEVVNPILDQWIYDIINDHYGDFPNSNFLLVIGGRDKISKEGNWEALKEYIEDIALKAFTKKEAIAYLEKAGITKPDTIDFILEASKRLPVYLSLLSEGSPDSPEEVGDPKEQIVSRFLKHIKEPVKKQLALSAALCQRIDKDIVECLLPEDQKANALDYFNWLKDRPFIRKIGGKWAYHSLVREIMLKYQKELSLLDWEKVHNSLAQFYKNRIDDLGIEDRKKQFSNQDFNNYHIEYSYHKLSANYTKFIPETIRDFVTIIGNQPYYSALPLVRTLLQAEVLNPNADWGKLLGKSLAELISVGEKGDGIKRLINKIISSNFVKDKEEKALLYSLLGNIFHYSNDNAKAVAPLKKAIELKPDYADAYNNLGNVLSYEKDNTGAIATYKKGIELKPDFAYAYYNLGNALRDEKDNTGAIAAYKKAIELKPDFAYAYYNLGVTLSYEKDNTGVIAAYRKAIELKPGDASAYYNLGVTLSDEKDNTGAIVAYKKAIELKPDYVPAYNNLGVTLSYEKDNTGAIAAYEKVIELKPDDAFAYNNLGLILRDENDNTGAIAAYKKVIELKPDDASAYNNLGVILRDENDNTSAIAAYKKAIKLKPDDADAYNNLGDTLSDEKDYEGAIEIYEKVIKLKLNDAADTWHSIGWNYLLWNKLKEAAFNLEKSWQLYEHKNGHPPMNLGHVSLLQKDEEQAKKWYKLSLPLWEDKTAFFSGMDSDYIDLKMEKKGVPKEKYKEIINELKA